VTILSAHGSPPEVYRQAQARRLRLIDATCPLVTKVHQEVQRYAREGYRIILIGHAGHDEVVGTMGEAPRSTVLVERVEDVARLELAPNQKGVILTQTTLSQDDTRELTEGLREWFPQLELPPAGDICYATQNRQNAIKQISPRVQLLLVVGSRNSSNSLRLTEVAKARGVQAHLINGPEDIDPEWLADVTTLGVSSGASAPEAVVQAVLAHLYDLGVRAVRELDAPPEGVAFKLPPFPSPTADDRASPDGR
jgi:4-hydroxy-3-methylbut-2-enyl diphosphate reductase